MVFPNALKLGFVGFLTFFFVVIFLFNHGPKGRRQYFIYSVTQLVRAKDVCVRHVNINQNLRSSFSTVLAQHPKKYNLATVWLLWGTAYCSWKSIIPTWTGGFLVFLLLCGHSPNGVCQSWPHYLSLHPTSLGEGRGVETSVTGI